MRRILSISIVPLILTLLAGILVVVAASLPPDVLLRKALTKENLGSSTVAFSTEMRVDSLDNFYFTLDYVKEKEDIPRLRMTIKDNLGQSLATLIAAIKEEGIYFRIGEGVTTYRYQSESLKNLVEEKSDSSETNLDKIDLKKLQEDMLGLLEFNKIAQSYEVTEIQRGHKSFNIWLRKSRYEIRSPLGSYEIDLLDHPFMRIFYVDFEVDLGEQKILFHTSFDKKKDVPKLFTDEEQIVDIQSIEQLMLLIGGQFNLK